MNECRHCNKSYEPKHKGSIFCGRSCANKHASLKRIKPRKNCLICQEPCKRAYTVLCSVACRTTHLASVYKGRTLNTGRTHFKRTVSKDLPNGQTYNWSGYIIETLKDENGSDKRGRIRQHRLVMQRHLGRLLDPTEEVHHINGDKTDNSIENLVILNKSEHAKLHAAQRRLQHAR